MRSYEGKRDGQGEECMGFGCCVERCCRGKSPGARGVHSPATGACTTATHRNSTGRARFPPCASRVPPDSHTIDTAGLGRPEEAAQGRAGPPLGGVAAAEAPSAGPGGPRKLPLRLARPLGRSAVSSATCAGVGGATGAPDPVPPAPEAVPGPPPLRERVRRDMRLRLLARCSCASRACASKCGAERVAAGVAGAAAAGPACAAVAAAPAAEKPTTTWRGDVPVNAACGTAAAAALADGALPTACGGMA